MLCAKCNYDNPNALFCMKCGTKVERRFSTYGANLCTSVFPRERIEHWIRFKRAE